MACIVDIVSQKSGLTWVQRADWDENEKVVIFGDNWWRVPDMPAETEPSREAVVVWARKHDDLWDEKGY